MKPLRRIVWSGRHLRPDSRSSRYLRHDVNGRERARACCPSCGNIVLLSSMHTALRSRVLCHAVKRMSVCLSRLEYLTVSSLRLFAKLAGD